MSDVFQYRGGRGRGWLGIFPIFKVYIETMSLRVECSGLMFGEVANRTSETYCCKFTGRVWSL